MRDIEQAIERNYEPPLPQPDIKAFEEAGLAKGRREGGSTLIVKNLEPNISGRDATGYLGITDSAEDAVKKINSANHDGVLVEFERNDLTIYSGERVYINPSKVVKVS